MIRYFLTSYTLFFAIIISVLFSSSVLLAQEHPVPFIELTVLISPSDHSLKGHAMVTVPEGISASFVQGKITLEAAKTMEGPITRLDEDSLNDYLSNKNKERRFEVSYSVSFPLQDSGTDVENSSENVIDPSGTVLLSGWHPALSVPSVYTLIAEVPSGYEALSESESIRAEDREDMRFYNFAYLYPRTSVSLVAGKYIRSSETYNEIEIETLFLSDNAVLQNRYLSAAKRFLILYRSMIGQFPYKRFAIVENPFVSIRSLSTYTLIRSDLLHDSSTAEAPLGRALLRQWFGNRVLIDPSSGDWAEGLVTYLADYWLEELRGSGAEYRKQIMVRYRNLINDENEFSLAEYIGQTSSAAKAIGSGKGAMVFHMLRTAVGNDTFFDALKELIARKDLQKVSWDDICDTFSKVSDSDLRSFCDYWIKKRGIPTISLDKAYGLFRDGNYLFELTLNRSGSEPPLPLPVQVTQGDKKDVFSVTFEEGKESVMHERIVDEFPSSTAVDPGYDVFRAPIQEEIPPVFSRFSGNRSNLVIVPEKIDDGQSKIVTFMTEKGFIVKKEKEITNDELENHSFLIFSTNNVLYRRLFAGKPLPEGNVLFMVKENPLNNREVVVILAGADIDDVRKALNSFIYGYSSLLLRNPDGTVHSVTSSSSQGIKESLEIPVSAINTQKTLALAPIIDQIQNKKVICIGEIHTEYSHHLMQFEIIKRLHESGKKLIIGMEMFQRPFQEYLDQYINGELDEKELLEKTEYFKRWAFNYNLYRDILNFARAEKIPVKALNLRKEIIDKVSKSGIDSLSDKEFSEIPQLLDMTNQEYRTFLKVIFSQHAKSANRHFDNFFQSQILWDETMALSAAETLNQNQDSVIIILAGNGHLQNSWGIPDRITRHTGVKPIVILNGGTDSIESSLADYLIFPGHADVPKPPLLMVSLKEEEDRILVENVMKGGPADRAGIQKGDVLKTIDGRAVRDIQDIKSVLFWKKLGEKVALSIERERFLFGPKKLKVTVVLR